MKLNRWWSTHLVEVIIIGAGLFIAAYAVYAVTWKLDVGRVPTISEVTRLETYAEGQVVGYTWLTPLHIFQASDGQVVIDIGGSRDQFHVGDRVGFMDDTGKIRDWWVFSVHQSTIRNTFDFSAFQFYDSPLQKGHYVTFLVDRP